ncbi:hypothetical protein DFH28DRAFT_404659 [Melampsora americana]|nr:hypothetical protein DFH28DRAFT_404659 [Melampsora americana]
MTTIISLKLLSRLSQSPGQVRFKYCSLQSKVFLRTKPINFPESTQMPSNSSEPHFLGFKAFGSCDLVNSITDKNIIDTSHREESMKSFSSRSDLSFKDQDYHFDLDLSADGKNSFGDQHLPVQMDK